MTIGVSSIASPSSDPATPLAISDFRFYWCARFAGVMATMAIVVVIGWQVYDVARSNYGMSPREAAFQLGLIGAAQFVPLAVLTPVSGWIADRFERRLVAGLASAVDLIVALGLAILTTRGSLTLPVLFTFAALHGVARAFVGPAMSSIAPNIVPAPLLPRAIAMSSIAWQTASVGGPALGGLLYAVAPSLPYWFAASALLLSIIMLLPIRRVVPPPIASTAHPVRQMADGLNYVRGHRFLFGAITLDLFAVLLGGATALLPVYARDILHVGPQGLGYLRGAPALGAAIVALLFAVVPLKHNVGAWMLGAVAGYGVATVVFGLARAMPLALGALTALGAFDMLSVYVRSSLIQLHTPDAMRGRVSAVSGLAVSASNELGELQSGLAAALLGPVGAVVAGGAAAVAIAGGWAVFFPELRQARTFDPPSKLETQ